jgi:hypothetical protein
VLRHAERWGALRAGGHGPPSKGHREIDANVTQVEHRELDAGGGHG